MKAVLMIFLMYGGEVQDTQPVKGFDNTKQCESFMKGLDSFQRMDIYMQYYRENRDTITKQHKLTFKCVKLPEENFA